MYPAIQMKQTQSNNGGQMVSTKGQALPLTKTTIRAIAKGGIARVVVTQVFHNVHEEALSVTYQLPLPVDGAVSGFSFLLQDRRVIGEVDRKNKARERYQRALSEGRSAALLEQERSSVFTQEIGNIPPKSRIEAEIIIDQRLVWMPDGCWEWRFPTVVAPKYMGESGRVRDAAKLQVEASQEPLDARLSFSVEVRDGLFGAPTSPSHMLTIEDAGEATLLSLAPKATRANQDVVVRWPVCSSSVGASLAVCRPEIGGLDHAAFGLLTLVPPAAEVEYVPRDLILLLDISGSMSGAPINQLKEVSRALIGSLQAQDQLEILAFADSTKRWRRVATKATESEKASAIQWLNQLQSSGGTEMKDGIMKALAPIRQDSQRQVIVMTDGHIGFEDEIVKAVFSRLPAGSRVHTLGIGSSVNRSLTSPVARAGRGVEQIVGYSESASAAAARLLERTNAPVVVGLRVGGDAFVDAASVRLPDLFAGAPALLSVKLKPEGGSLWIEGYAANGLFRRELQVKPTSPNQGDQMLAALYARESVEDLELGICAGKKKAEADQQIEEIGVAFQIATRLTSWVAISKEVTVDTAQSARHEVMPQELPDGMNAASLGLRPVNRPTGAFTGKVARKQIALPPIEALGLTQESTRVMVVEAKASALEEKLMKDLTSSIFTFDDEENDEDDALAMDKIEAIEEPTRVSGVELAIDEIESTGELSGDAGFDQASDITLESLDEQSAPETTRPQIATRSIKAEERRESHFVGEETTKRSKSMPAKGGEEKKRGAAPKKKGGILSRIGGFLFGSGGNPIVLQGSIAEQTATRLVVVFTLTEDLAWPLASTVRLLFGTKQVKVSVEQSQSTKVGSQVRLVLTLDAKTPTQAPQELLFSVGGNVYKVSL